MVSRNVEDVYPLSPMQLGIMFLTLNNPDEPVYVQQIRLRLDGLEAGVFRQAWLRMFLRFASLRTSIVGTGRQEPAQVVRREIPLPWEEHDCRSLPAEDQHTWFDEFLQRDLSRGFDLGEPTLNRLALIRTGDRRHELVWTSHHIVLDGPSCSLILDDLLETYEAMCRGAAPSLPDRRPFRDHVLWARSQDGSRADRYWRRVLAGFDAPTRWRRKPAPWSGLPVVNRYSCESLVLPRGATSALAAQAASERITLDTMVMGAWAAVLGGYSGADDVLFGRVVTGRHETIDGAGSMVGMLVNTVPVRAGLPERASVRDWLRELEAEQRERRPYENVSLWEVQRCGDVPAATPLFDSLLTFDGAPAETGGTRASGLRVEVVPPLDRTGYPLLLRVSPGETMTLTATYDAERIELATIRRVLEHVAEVLAGLARDGRGPVGRLTALVGGDRAPVIDDERSPTDRTRPDAPPRGGEAHVAPRGPHEEALAEIWWDVLGVERPGIRDDFFAMGGHSLTAVRFVSRVRETLRVDLPPRIVFDHPTIAGLSTVIESRTPDAALPPLAATARVGAPEPSFAQQRLWRLDRAGAGSTHNPSWAFRIDGHLDVPALERSINDVVERHDALRTRFPGVDGKPVQEILPAADVPLDRVDLTHRPEAERDAEARCLLEELVHRPFDLARGPLVRTTLLRLGECRSVLLLAFHRIVFDGWSIDVLTRELAAHYRARVAGEPAPLPPLDVQYDAFSEWQRRWIESPAGARALEYWRDRLAEVPSLDLSGDRPRSPVRPDHGGAHTLACSPELTRDLRTLSRRRGVTLAMTLLAAFKTLLARCTGEVDIAVGSPAANRTRREIEGLIGLCANTLVLRTDLSGDPTFDETLRRVQATALGAYEHQHVPFERLLQELPPPSDTSRHPLARVLFALRPAPRRPFALPGLQVCDFAECSIGAHADLELHLADSPAGLRGALRYDRAVFDAASIARLADRFQLLLAGIIATPDARLSRLPILPETERQQILGRTDNAPAVASGPCLHRQFEEQAERTPDAVAVADASTRLTYRQVDQRANRLANRLRASGVGPDVPVGLCLNPSPELVTGTLGILKAGGGCLPLDPANPKERLAVMLGETRAPVVVTTSDHLDKLPGHDVVCLDRDRDEIGRHGDERPAGGVRPEHLAYVIYTSGPAGKPTAVLVEHRSVTRLFAATRARFQFDARDVWPLLHPCALDRSVWEVWGALLHGGRLVVVTREVSRSPEDLYRLLSREAVTVLNQTPSSFRALTAADELLGHDHALALRLVILGDEAPPRETLRPWLEPRGDQRPQLVDTFGVIEVAGDVTHHPVSQTDLDAVGRPIGRPIPDLRVYVLDEHGQPVPIGVRGELCVGGACVTRGYLDRPELTAARFVPDPFGPEPGARLVRTGDFGRLRPNGELEHLGRHDRQVSIRGYRVALDEIDMTLRGLPGVRDAVVTLRDDDRGDHHLVGYVVPDPDVISDEEEKVVGQWQSLYDDTYQERTDESDPTFNIVGWNSSYTGEPIPAEQMRHWVLETAQRIRRDEPRRVLEIGCGTGLLLFQIAPHCREYVGTDFSAAALDYVRRHAERIEGLPERLTLRQSMAHEFADVPQSRYDAVVLNSVIQYFPNVGYLLRVIEGAVAAAAPGGRVHLGDVRNLRLLEAFHASVQLALAPDALSTTELEQLVRQRMAQERELVVAPEFFLALADHIQRVTHVEIQPKRAATHNELTKFRYEVTLHVDDTGPRVAPPEAVDWSEQCPSVDDLRTRLRQGHGPRHLRGVPNARTSLEALTAALLREHRAGGTVAELRGELARHAARPDLDPARLCALEDELPYRASLSWRLPGDAGEFDVLFTPADEPDDAAFPMPRLHPEAWSAYANQPSQTPRTRRGAPSLREDLGRVLPPHMVPARIVTIDAVPRTRDGSVDHEALPEPAWHQRVRHPADVGPRAPVERPR